MDSLSKHINTVAEFSQSINQFQVYIILLLIHIVRSLAGEEVKKILNQRSELLCGGVSLILKTRSRFRFGDF